MWYSFCDGWYSPGKLYQAQFIDSKPSVLGGFIYWKVPKRKETKLKRIEGMSRADKDAQVRKEARATLLLFAICFAWNVVFAYALSGSGIRLGGLPLWWLISVPGMFIVAVIGVLYLLKYVFVNFDLDDKAEGGAANE